jgi:hypothetical protein
MPKIITLVEDEYDKLKAGAVELYTKVEDLVKHLTEAGHATSTVESTPQAAAVAAATSTASASAAALKAHLTDPKTLLVVPDISPKSVEVSYVVPMIPTHAPASNAAKAEGPVSGSPAAKVNPEYITVDGHVVPSTTPVAPIATSSVSGAPGTPVA